MTQPGLSIIATGEATSHRADLLSHARSQIRYADPAAWVVASAIAVAISDFKSQLAESKNDVGLLVVSDRGPAETLRVVAEAASEGFSSPLRYPAANPASLAGVSCIALGLHGPTLNLTMDPGEGVPIALLVCEAWLKRGAAKFMVVASLAADSSDGIRGRALLLALPDATQKGPLVDPTSVGWLSGRPLTPEAKS